MAEYPKNSEVILTRSVDDSKVCETIMKKVFKSLFIQRTDIGSEYFEGNIYKMTKEFMKILKLLDDYSEKSVELFIQSKQDASLDSHAQSKESKDTSFDSFIQSMIGKTDKAIFQYSDSDMLPVDHHETYEQDRSAHINNLKSLEATNSTDLDILNKHSLFTEKPITSTHEISINICNKIIRYLKQNDEELKKREQEIITLKNKYRVSDCCNAFIKNKPMNCHIYISEKWYPCVTCRKKMCKGCREYMLRINGAGYLVCCSCLYKK